MPSGPIQLIPPGLLGFLQLKVGGLNPDQLGDTLLPVLDLLEWYLQTNAEDLTGTTGNVATGALGGTATATGETFIVPDKQYWYVHSFSVFVNTTQGAADRIGAAPQIQDNVVSNGINRLLAPLQTDFATAAAVKLWAFHADGPFFAPPGSQLQLWIGAFNTAVANTQFLFRARITRLPI